MRKRVLSLLLAAALLVALTACSAPDKKEEIFSVTDCETGVTLALEDKKVDVEALLGPPETGYAKTDDAMERATYYDDRMTLYYDQENLLRDITIESSAGQFQYRGIDFPMAPDELETLFKYVDADEVDGQAYVYHYNEYDTSGKETEQGGSGYRVTVRTQADDTGDEAIEEVEALIIATN